jgi:hypothetical protein
MKLFKSLLVAPAALGLLAPMTATANELNLNDVSGYSSSEEVQNISEFNATDLAVTNSRVDGLEARFNDYEAGSFSSTTSASFSVDMAIGSVDGNTTSEAVGTAYGYQIDLTTSFTGEDSLDVAIDSGVGAGQLGELDLNSNGSTLAVDGISYTFPVGEKLTVLVGDSSDGSALYSTACVYGGFTNTLDDCGNFNSAFIAGPGQPNSVALSAAMEIGNGFTGALGFQGQGTGTGLMNKESTDYYGGQLSYAADSYGASVTYANLDTATSWALNGYYTFASDLPSVSLGYEFTENEGTTADQTQWFAGLQWDEVGPGSLGVSAGNKGPQSDGGTEEMAYEAFYAYSVNDSMTVTPAVFILENNGSGETDETGVVVKTSFSF